MHLYNYFVYLTISPPECRIVEFCKVKPNFWVCGRNPMMWPFKWNLSTSTYTWCYFFFQNFTNELWDFLSNFAFGHIWLWKVEATSTRLVFSLSSTYLFPVVWFVGNLYQCWTSPTLVFSVKTYRHLLMIWCNLKQKDDKHISLQTQTYFWSSPLWRPKIRLRSQANTSGVGTCHM